MALPPLDVLFVDNHLLALNKPAGLATMGVSADKPSLFKQAQQYIKQRYQKPGNVYLGVVSRLDAAVSGVVVFARTSKAAARLSEQFREHRPEKTYWALVAGRIEPAEGELVDWLWHDESHKRMAIGDRNRAGAVEARLRFRLLASLGGDSLVDVQLLSGRKHQIRVQLTAAGHPIRGDRKYGSQQSFASGIALHSRRLVLDHPTRHEPVDLLAPLPAYWPMFPGLSERK